MRAVARAIARAEARAAGGSLLGNGTLMREWESIRELVDFLD